MSLICLKKNLSAIFTHLLDKRFTSKCVGCYINWDDDQVAMYLLKVKMYQIRKNFIDGEYNKNASVSK